MIWLTILFGWFSMIYDAQTIKKFVSDLKVNNGLFSCLLNMSQNSKRCEENALLTFTSFRFSSECPNQENSCALYVWYKISVVQTHITMIDLAKCHMLFTTR